MDSNQNAENRFHYLVLKRYIVLEVTHLLDYVMPPTSNRLHPLLKIGCSVGRCFCILAGRKYRVLVSVL